MKKRILNSVIIFTMLICTLFVITGCANKTENVTVYINDGLSDSKITEIEKTLKEMDGVNTISYTTKAEVYEEVKESLGQDALEISGYTKEIHPFPTYFSLEVKKNKNIDTLIKEIESIEGVKMVKKDATVKDLINAEMNYIRNNK